MHFLMIMENKSLIIFLILLIGFAGCINTPPQASTTTPEITQSEITPVVTVTAPPVIAPVPITTPLQASTTTPEVTQPVTTPTTTITTPPVTAPAPTTTSLNTSGKVQVHFIDVGQGDSILIETPNHEAILIDGGDNGKGSIVAAYIQKEGIKDIDVLIATHPHADHIGGLDEIMASISVNATYDSGETATTKTYTDYITMAKTHNYRVIQRGFNFTLDNVFIQVLNPSGTLKSNPNDNSIVIKATFGNIDFIFTGDCEIECEQDILRTGFNIDSEVLKVGHHGSRTSTSQAFLNAVTPEVAVISVGTGNRYGHPHQETLNKLSSIDYYRTDTYGTVVIEANATNYWVTTEKTAFTSTSSVTVQPSATAAPLASQSPTPVPTTAPTVTTTPPIAYSVVICEVIYDPPGQEPDDELIKLCNQGSSAADIGGWRLTDGEGTYTIPSGTIITAGGSWSVFGYTYNPTRYTKGLYLANSHDEVILYDKDGNKVDEHSW